MKTKKKTKNEDDTMLIIAMMVIVGMVLVFVAYLITLLNNSNNPNNYSNNLSTLPIGSITELHLWGYVNGQPEYDINMNYTYIVSTQQEQELGFMNQTSYGYGNMLFLFNNDTMHCFWDKNTGTNLTLYWIDWNAESSGGVNTKLGTITTITQLSAYNTTPECVVSDAVMESIKPQILRANDYISVYMDYDNTG